MPRTEALPRRPVPRGPLPTARRPSPSPPNPTPRRRNQELDPNLRTQITTLKNVANWSYSQIQKKYPDIPLSTIKSTCLKARNRDNEQSLKRSGRPKKLDDTDRDKILQKIHESPQATYEDLMAAVDYKVKRHTIGRLLSLEGLKKRRVMKRPHLKPEHAAA